MTDSDDVLTEIGSGLDLEPSVEFAVGVHERVRRARRRTARVRWALAVAASLGVVAVLGWRPSVRPPEKLAFAPEAAPAVAPVAVKPAIGVPDHAAKPRAPQPRVQATLAAVAATEPHLEVITNQGEVLRALWADYRGKPVGLVVTDADADASTFAAPIVIEPIVVPSIVVKNIGGEPDQPASRSVVPNIRRDNATKEMK